MDKTKIHVNSNLLRQPQLFDKLCYVVGKPTNTPKLGKQISRLARDLVLYAAWNKAPVVRLHIPEFCQMFGHDAPTLLKKATPAQKDEMRACSLPEDLIPYYSNYLGYVLVKMANYSFLWNKNSGKINDTSVDSHHIVEKIDAPRIRRKRGSYVEFTVSLDIVQQNRRGYQTMWLEDYLALVTAPGGYAWEAARRLYMRVVWKRRWWDYLEKEGLIRKDDRPSHDDYTQLIAAAGIEAVSPLRVQASKLMAMLKRIGMLPSVCMVPQMQNRKGCYYVTWTRYEVGTVGGPPKNLVYECEPVPATWGTDPTPPSTTYNAEDEDHIYKDVSWSPGAGASAAVRATWARCLHHIEGQVEESDFYTWFLPIVPVERTGNVLTIQVPNIAHYEHLEAEYVNELRQALQQELGDDGRLEYSVVIVPTKSEASAVK